MTSLRGFPGKEQGLIARVLYTRFSDALIKHGFARIRESPRWERGGRHFVEAIAVQRPTPGPDLTIQWHFAVPNPAGKPLCIGASSDPDAGPACRYPFRFGRSLELQDQCFAAMVRFTEEIVLPWFARWASPEPLSQNPEELRKLVSEAQWIQVNRLIQAL